jgi:hypothetical protein
MEVIKINKAEEKRIKEAVATLTSNLERMLFDFKERFLTSYVNYCFAQFDNEISSVNGKSKWIDIRASNIGYDMENNLKLLDF